MEPNARHAGFSRFEPARLVYRFDEEDRHGPWPSGDQLVCAGSCSDRRCGIPACPNPAHILMWHGDLFYSVSSTCGGHLGYAMGDPRTADSGLADLDRRHDIRSVSHVLAVWVSDGWKVDHRHREWYGGVQPALEFVDRQVLDDLALEAFRQLHPTTHYPPPCDHPYRSCSATTARLAAGSEPLFTVDDDLNRYRRYRYAKGQRP